MSTCFNEGQDEELFPAFEIMVARAFAATALRPTETITNVFKQEFIYRKKNGRE